MNNYRNAMDFCTPPADLEERLQQRLATATAKKSRIIHPWSFARRALLAAVLILMITASVGATFLLDWDDIFASRFGPDAASLPITETAYQKVNVTSVCGDVTLTVREALGDNKTIYLILDYVVPVSANRETVQKVWDSEDDSVGCPSVDYFATDAVSWEMLFPFSYPYQSVKPAFKSLFSKPDASVICFIFHNAIYNSANRKSHCKMIKHDAKRYCQRFDYNIFCNQKNGQEYCKAHTQ